VPFQSAFHGLFTQDAWIAAAVFLLVLAVMAGAALLSRRRRKRDQGPSPRAKADRLEIGYVVALAGIVGFLVASSFSANAREFPDPQPALRVQVTSYQWCWRFHYVGQSVTISGQCLGGPVPTLVLPAGRPVELELTSVDVIHAFWAPYLRFKLYAYPGHTETFSLTLDHPGRWPGRCAQLCGLYHYGMDFYLEAVSPAAFDRFVHARSTAGPAGRAAVAAALTASAP
jgi:cytochrome c oxidase subunit 2